MEQSSWVAKKYKYLDGIAWNSGRYTIFVPDPNKEGELIPVGGAFETHGRGAIAFLCFASDLPVIKRPLDAERRSEGLYTWGQSLREALAHLKWKYPQPFQILAQRAAIQTALF
jgi:hypothetical protein